MKYIRTPLAYGDDASQTLLERDLDSQAAFLDNLIEIVAFTPRGSFAADPEFGFEYWNHEFANIQYRSFNNGQTSSFATGTRQEITKSECQNSIKQSLAAYAPQLKNVMVSVELNPANNERQQKKKLSKHLVTIIVEGDMDSGISTKRYRKEINFLMEPTSKRWR